MAALDVLCVGSVTMDTIAVVSSIPGPDERVLAETFVRAGGGPAATAAVALARLGARVGLCGVIGDDETGEQLRHDLEREGVVVQWLTTRPRSESTQSVVLVSGATAERTIVAQRAPEPRAEDVPIGVSTWVHVDQTGLAPVRGALAATGASPLLSIDAGNGCDTPDLSGVTVFAPSVSALLKRYARADSVDAALDLARRDGATCVVATDGSRGAYVRSADVDAQVPAYAMPVVSTLGAGDVFHGALLAGLVRGLALLDATQEASAAAALSCRALDGRSAIPSRADLSHFLRQHPARGATT